MISLLHVAAMLTEWMFCARRLLLLTLSSLAEHLSSLDCHIESEKVLRRYCDLMLENSIPLHVVVLGLVSVYFAKRAHSDSDKETRGWVRLTRFGCE